MPWIEQSSIEKLKQQINIIDVVSAVVSLKRAGSQYRGLSPFSNEKTPSFFVNPGKNVFFCYSSGQGGDSVRFVQLYEKLNYYEALEALADRFQIHLEYEKNKKGVAESRSLRRELLDIHDLACQFYYQYFKADNSVSDSVRSYWQNDRKFSLEIADDYKIGLSPVESGKLIDILTKKKFSFQSLKKCGLLLYFDNESNPRKCKERFCGRLMIPIRDIQGQVIAFTARKIDKITPAKGASSDAKYINSPETPLFHKSGLVFNIDRARHHVDENTPFIMVEGQLDAIRCWANGIKSAIAPQGTAITEDQLILLKRYSSRIKCLMDGDSAGIKAAMRLLPLALQIGHELQIIQLPAGADPDLWILQNGSSSIDKLEKNSLSPVKFAIKSYFPDPTKTPSPQELSDAVTKIFELVTVCESSVARDAYLKEAVNLLRLNETAVQTDFKRFVNQKKRRNSFSQTASKIEIDQEKTMGRLTTAEFDLLYLLLQNDDLIVSISEVVDVEWINSGNIHGKLLRRIIVEKREGLWQGINKIDTLLENDEEQNCIYSMLTEDREFENPVKMANNCIKRIVEEYANKRIKEIDNIVANLPNPSPDFKKLMNELKELRKLKKISLVVNSK